MEKSLLGLVFGFLAFLVLGEVQAWAVVDPLAVANNRIGVHILDSGEVGDAARLVNSSGGDWGYVVVPLRANDRDFEKWRIFFEACKELHVIPAVRLATYAEDGGWAQPTEYEVLDMANFLAQMPWPVRNRYVVVYNEPNHAAEWGGAVDPAGYAAVLGYAVEVFKERSEDFFVMGAGLDASAPDNSTSFSSWKFMRKMQMAVPGIFSKVDGWVSHSYPNPGFVGRPTEEHRRSVMTYRYEVEFLGSLGARGLPVFITETGWDSEKVGLEKAGDFFREAFDLVWTDDQLVAVVPFVLRATGGAFEKFSLIGREGKLLPTYLAVAELPKIGGTPLLSVAESGLREPDLLLGNMAGTGYGGRVAGANVGPVGVLSIDELVKQIGRFWEKVGDWWGGMREVWGKLVVGSGGDGNEAEVGQRAVEDWRVLKVGGAKVRVEVAETPEEVRQGLSGRESLGEDEGMLFELRGLGIPRFWMKEMLFDLDFVWIRGDEVVDITENVPKPVLARQKLPTYSPRESVDRVLEVNAGWVARHGIVAGDEVKWE